MLFTSALGYVGSKGWFGCSLLEIAVRVFLHISCLLLVVFFFFFYGFIYVRMLNQWFTFANWIINNRPSFVYSVASSSIFSIILGRNCICVSSYKGSDSLHSRQMQWRWIDRHDNLTCHTYWGKIRALTRNSRQGQTFNSRQISYVNMLSEHLLHVPKMFNIHR